MTIRTIFLNLGIIFALAFTSFTKIEVDQKAQQIMQQKGIYISGTKLYYPVKPFGEKPQPMGMYDMSGGTPENQAVTITGDGETLILTVTNFDGGTHKLELTAGELYVIE